jgi:lysophospholipase L1-like esterase
MAQATYRAFTKAVADAEGCALLDLHELWTRAVGGGWDNAYAAGLMADGLHPTQKGHDLIASAVCELLGVA